MTTRQRCAVLLVCITVFVSCGSNGDTKQSNTVKSQPAETTLTVLTHSAFAMPEGALTRFKQQTGITVKLIQDGDAGALVNKAILTRDNPQADVLYGVDNAFLSRALDEKVFAPVAYRALDAIDADHRDQFGVALRSVVPVDYGDVCVNYDKDWFRSRRIDPPRTLDDLTNAKYAGLTVVENPASSSPGLAFLIATRARHPRDGWRKYWQALQRNDVTVVDDWTVAFETEFSAGGGGGTRPIMVSYASSPPADVVYSEGAKSVPSIAAIEDGCVRQYEFAGVLANAQHPVAGARFVEYMLSDEFQKELPLSNFVFPTRRDVVLPDVFVKFALVPSDPITFDYSAVGRDRSEWIRQWTELVLG